jgi:hypothetical protein
MESIELAKQVDDALKAMGISLPPAVAGFIGALISLRFLASMNPIQVWITLGTGFLAAGYLTPTVLTFFAAPAGGVGFGIGFCAMGLLGGVMGLINQFASDPGSFLSRWTKLGKKDADQ